ncbi:Serine/threonine-protein kinase, active site [Sesbania bispinosa]|nr:Serine/threonine-protein kinase, active site [Sesbania bispinosa]
MAFLGKRIWELHHNSSKLWVQAGSCLKDGFRFKVGNGDVSFWYEDWRNEGPLCDSVLFVDIHDTQMRVRDVWHEDRWHLNQLFTILSSEIISNLQNRVLHLNDAVPDVIHWEPNISGVYSVKEGYKWLMNRDFQAFSTEAWDWIWKMRTTESIRFFCWLLNHGALPTKLLLFRRHMLRIQFTDRELTLPFRDWIFNGYKRHGDLFCVALWVMWCNRNRVCFEGVSQRTQFLLPQVQSLVSGLRDSFAPREMASLAEPMMIKWITPSFGAVALNTDGSYQGSSGRAGFGGLVRDHLGCWSFGFLGNAGDKPILWTKLWAIAEGLKLAWNRGFRVVECFSDSLLAIQLILSGNLQCIGGSSMERNGVSNDYSSEDEGTEGYRRGGYHAVRVGDIFKNGCYVVQSKLGWGLFPLSGSLGTLSIRCLLSPKNAFELHRSRYVALKIQKSAQHYTEAALDEIKILKQVAEGDHDDKKCVVKLLDHFKHSGPNGLHVCLVFEFLGDNLLTLVKYSGYRGVPLPMVKEICFHILVGLDYLHRELSIIHTDLKPENVLLLSLIDPYKDPRKSGAPLILPTTEDKAVSNNETTKDNKILNGDLMKNQKKKMQRKARKAAQGCVEKESPEEAEEDYKEPEEEDCINGMQSSVECVEDKLNTSLSEGESTKTVEKDVSQGSHGHKSRSKGKKLLAAADLKCKLVDLGSACWTYKQFTNDIQTRQYRCPEVLLGSKYSTPADLWSFACICFELATGDVLFDPHSGENYDRDEVVKTMIGMRVVAIQFNAVPFHDRIILCWEMLQSILLLTLRSSGIDDGASWNDASQGRQVICTAENFKVLTEKYDFSDQDANDMADFLVPILDFVPEKRPTAAQCLSHPWISAGPRTLESSMTILRLDAINEELSEKRKREKAEQELVEVGVRNIAINGTPELLKDSQPLKSSK